MFYIVHIYILWTQLSWHTPEFKGSRLSALALFVKVHFSGTLFFLGPGVGSLSFWRPPLDKTTRSGGTLGFDHMFCWARPFSFTSKAWYLVIRNQILVFHIKVIFLVSPNKRCEVRASMPFIVLQSKWAEASIWWEGTFQHMLLPSSYNFLGHGLPSPTCIWACNLFFGPLHWAWQGLLMFIRCLIWTRRCPQRTLKWWKQMIILTLGAYIQWRDTANQPKKENVSFTWMR